MPRAPPASTELRATKSTKLTGLNPSILARASLKRDPGPVSRYPSIHPSIHSSSLLLPLPPPFHSSISRLQTSTSILFFSSPVPPSSYLSFVFLFLSHSSPPASLSPIDLTSIDQIPRPGIPPLAYISDIFSPSVSLISFTFLSSSSLARHFSGRLCSEPVSV